MASIETNVWNDPRSYAQNLNDNIADLDHFERVARQLRDETAIAWNDLLFGAACGLIAGMLATVGLAYAVGLFL